MLRTIIVNQFPPRRPVPLCATSRAAGVDFMEPIE